MKLKSIVGVLAVVAVAAYFFGQDLYLAVRSPDPILPGWEEYNDDAYPQYVASGERILLEIYASWCPVCQSQHKAFEDLQAEGIPANIRAIRVDFEKDSAFRESLGINFTGALLVYEKGARVASSAGLETPDEVRAFLLKHFPDQKSKLLNGV